LRQQVRQLGRPADQIDLRRTAELRPRPDPEQARAERREAARQRDADGAESDNEHRRVPQRSPDRPVRPAPVG
jgi:hypothetical protein